jgi:pantetheine-phosphate adenylyltransferase
MKKIIALYPGTFDPITNGHLDIIERASSLFDRVIVTIALNSSKKPLFSEDERKEMILQELKKHKNVEVGAFRGLLVEYAKKKKASVIIRGLRAISDYEYEFQMALTNRKISPEVTTMFMMPNEKYTYLNSTLVKELAAFKGNIKCFVPKFVEKKLREKFKNRL